MTIKVDPEENETGALFDFVNLAGARVLEIGSGDCRLTWGYADRVEHVTAVEPFAPAITRARQQLPRELEGRVLLRQTAFAEFAAQTPRPASMSQSFPGLCCIEQDRMVPALDEAHRLLGPSGPLIDIHPVFGTAQVEVHRAGKVVFAEAVPADEGVLHADEALHHVTARGLFVSERHKEFDFRVYGSSGDELRDFLTRPTRTRAKLARRRAMGSSPSCSRGWTASWLAKRARRKSPTTNGRGLRG
jgi:hypothetical protein